MYPIFVFDEYVSGHAQRPAKNSFIVGSLQMSIRNASTGYIRDDEQCTIGRSVTSGEVSGLFIQIARMCILYGKSS